jgi:hypothetical protein
MSPVAGPLRRLEARIVERAATLGWRGAPDFAGLTDRSGDLALAKPGLVSPNGSCRLVAAADGWLAVNLPRPDDLDLVPAWLDGAPVEALDQAVAARPWRELAARARELGLPVAGVGEVAAAGTVAPLLPTGCARRGPRGLVRVLDLSTLWAGPLCGAVLAAFGAEVVKLESRRRPDPGRTATPDFFRRLNGAKADKTLDFADADGRGRLRELMLAADVVITSARPRAFAQMGLSPERLFAERPDLVWVAVSGYGWGGDAGDRVAFGDDAAAAGGLVRWTAAGEPHFLGDALADPLTGLSAAAGALQALVQGGGVIVDAALAATAAGAAAELGLARTTS